MTASLSPSSLQTLLEQGSPYQAYSYSYPHKTAYRPLDPGILLAEVWQTEPRHALFLYLHIPFCEMRCGFCNLFTQAYPSEDKVERYLVALSHEAHQVRQALGTVTFARLALGGGTPTYCSVRQLEQVFTLIQETMGAHPTRIPTSVEVSPLTATPDKIALLSQYGVERVSIGIQSFIDREASSAGRPQDSAQVLKTLDNLRASGIPTLNLDLIYGLPGQTPATFQSSLETALRFTPEEVYLYPLYVRPLTGLGLSTKGWIQEQHERLALYRRGREFLLSRGYSQVSMRMFRSTTAPDPGGPVYCCQDDGMVGLGCGARSYTRTLHYSTEYAVGATGVQSILDTYLRRSPESFAHASYGIRLGEEDQRRRYLIQSLLQQEGLSLTGYTLRFGGSVWDHFPELAELDAMGWAIPSSEHLRLTPAGLEHSDLIGPWLYSQRVNQLSQSYEWR